MDRSSYAPRYGVGWGCAVRLRVVGWGWRRSGGAVGWDLGAVGRRRGCGVVSRGWEGVGKRVKCGCVGGCRHCVCGRQRKACTCREIASGGGGDFCVKMLVVRALYRLVIFTGTQTPRGLRACWRSRSSRSRTRSLSRTRDLYRDSPVSGLWGPLFNGVVSSQRYLSLNHVVVRVSQSGRYLLRRL